MDSGNGIHNTLGEKYNSWDDIKRLDEAYKRGVTRHKAGKNKAGFGLDDSMRTVKNLKACVSISSGNIYSSKTFKELKGESIQFNDYKKLKKSSGTSQSITLPYPIVREINSNGSE